MLSLYEILKASKTGIAPDMWTALAGMNWGGADSGHEVKKLTGVPPLSFRADGSPLMAWRISGNTVQSTTPTPDNPIMPQGTGESTGNLFDYQTMAHGTDGMFLDENGNLQSSNAWVVTAFIPCNGSAFTLHKVGGGTPAICLYDAEKRYIIGKRYNTGGASTKSDITIISQTNASYIRFSWYRQNDATQDDLTTIMLNLGSEAFPYEPYGYKLDISSGDTTTPVYLGEVETTRRVKKLVLTGEETSWTKASSAKVYYLWQYDDDALNSANIISCMCSHYSAQGNVATVSGVENLKCCFQTTAQTLYIHDDAFESNADFVTYLQQQYAAGTPVTVWYVLATPETAIVNEPLMKIGDYADEVSNVATIPTNNGSTTIDVETAVKPSEVYIKYKGV